MSGGSSSVVAWSSRLEPPQAPPCQGGEGGVPNRPDDPRLGEILQPWQGDAASLRPGRAVLVGFPQDEGVRRNHGRAGAARAPDEIRRWLRLLTLWDGARDADLSQNPPLDAGNVRITGSLEDTQAALGEVVGGILKTGAVPVVLGGGHETAYGHFLGYVAADRKVGILNLDAHLDVRSCLGEPGASTGLLGHSGSPFRQALEHPSGLLLGRHYVCLGAQPHSVSRAHWDYVHERGGRVVWRDAVRASLPRVLAREIRRLARARCQVYVTVDADVVHVADVPGVSAPNPAGFRGRDLVKAARQAGRSPHVTSFELVEINPALDRDGQSARWAGLVVWHFLVGLANRAKEEK